MDIIADMKVGIIGVRGYKVVYSGFETFVTQLVKRLRSNEVQFLLYVRSTYHKTLSPKNSKFVSVPTPNGKHLGTFVYSMFSNLHSYFSQMDVVLYLGVVNASIFILLQKLADRKVIVNVDGIDWQRSRWSNLGKFYIKACEKLCVLFADYLICDSKTVMQYYKNKYHTDKIVYIPYGSEVRIRKPGKALKRFDLLPRKYFLFVGRLVPENSIEDLVMAFKNAKTDNYKCVIVGDSTYEDKYKRYLLNLMNNDERFVLTGFLKGKDYEEICSNAYVYVETKNVGGTHPSLLEAMGFGNCVVAKDVPFHKEVLKGAGIYYARQNSITNLKEKLEFLLDNPTEVIKYRDRARVRAKDFSWTKVIAEYESLFRKSLEQ